MQMVSDALFRHKGVAHKFACGEVFLKGQVHESVASSPAFHKQPGLLPDSLEKVISGVLDFEGIRVILSAFFRQFLCYLLFCLRFTDDAGGVVFVYPIRQGTQKTQPFVFRHQFIGVYLLREPPIVEQRFRGEFI